VSNAVVAFDSISIIDTSLTPVPTPTPTPSYVPPTTSAPPTTAYPAPTPPPLYAIKANASTIFRSETVCFDVNVRFDNESVTYEIVNYEMPIPTPPPHTTGVFPSCVLNSNIIITATGTLNGGGIWGDNNFGYTDDTDWARAVVHSGLAIPGETVKIFINCSGIKTGFPASYENSIYTSEYPNPWCAAQILFALKTNVPLKTLTHNQTGISFKPVNALGGSSFATYSVTPALPNGLNLISSNGTITGTANAVSSTTTYTMTVVDTGYGALNPRLTATFQIGVVEFTATATANKTFTLNQSITPFNIFSVTGGIAPLTYAITSANLPTGLIFTASTGSITGTPTVGTVNRSVSIAVTDSNGVTRTGSFEITIS
jgi:hypothetical protein